MDSLNKHTANLAVWCLLLTMPFWIRLLGGYTELCIQVIVFALAAMSLNFLLGFTGVLSFGHAAYFGLGAYGTAMTIKYLVPSTPLALLVGMVVGTIAAAIIGKLIVNLRGVYFAMVTIAFGQVFYFITFRWNTVTGGDDGLTGGSFDRSPASPSIDILHNQHCLLLHRPPHLCGCGWDHGVAFAVSVRAHVAGDPRE